MSSVKAQEKVQKQTNKKAVAQQKTSSLCFGLMPLLEILKLSVSREPGHLVRNELHVI